MPRGGTGGDPIASHLDALTKHLEGDHVGLTLVEGLKAHLDPRHPLDKARRVYTNGSALLDAGVPELPPPPTNYSVAEVGHRLGLSRQTVWRRVKDGSIPTFRIGREYRITQATLDGLLRGAK